MRKVALGLALSGVIASQAHAVGLGEIRTHSSLNQPLSANIELVETAASDIDDIQVSLAPRAVFEQVGINRSQLLDQLEFIPTIENGVPTIKVVSLQPIQEPFLNFVLEVTWANGKLLREYTVLLDPPVFSDTQYAATPAPAPVVETVPEVVAPVDDKTFVVAPPVVDTAAAPDVLVSAPEVPVAQTEAMPMVSEPEIVAGAQGLDPFVTVPDAAPVDTVSEAEAFMYEGLETYPVEEIAGLPEPVVVSEAEIAAELNQPIPEGIDPFMPAGALPEPETLAFETGSEPRYDDYPIEETFALADDAVEFVDPGTGTEQIFVAESELTPAEAEIESIFVDEAPQVATAPVAKSSASDTYRVARGDSLSRIAAKVGVPGALNQTMVALLQENPDAFINNNMNLVRAGYILRVPDAETINGISQQEALSLIASQNSAWKEYRNQVADVAAPQFDSTRFAGIADLESRVPADLEATEIVRDTTEIEGEAGVEDLVKAPTDLEILVPEGEGDSVEGTDKTGSGAIGNLEHELSLAKEQLESQTQQNAELRSRVDELESLLESKNRLIELKNEQLAEFQEQLADEQPASGESVVDEAVSEATEVASSAADAVKDSAKGVLPKTGVEQEVPLPESETSTQAEAEKESTTAVKEPVADRKPEKYEEPSMLDGFKDNPNLVMGAGFGGLLLAALGWLMLRRKDDDETDTVVATAAAPEPTLKDEASEQAEKALEESTAELEEQELVSLDATADTAMDNVSEVVEEVESGSEALLEEAGVDVSTDDEPDDEVMSEANVYLAYGLQDQAIDLLKPVVEENPDRTDYAIKLAEAYHSTGDKEGFEALAKDLKGRVGGEEWAAVAVWGKDLLPDSDLFSDTDTGDLTVTQVGTKAPEMDVSDLGDSIGDIEADLIEEASAQKDDVEDSLSESLSIDMDEVESPDQVGEIDLKELDDLDLELGDDKELLQSNDDQELLNDDLISAELDSIDEVSLDDISLDEKDDVLMTSELEGINAELDPGSSTVGMELDDLNLDTLVGDDESLTVFSAGEDEVSTKLDLAKAYLDMGDDEGAREALDEVINMGSEEQRNEANKLKSQLDA